MEGGEGGYHHHTTFLLSSENENFSIFPGILSTGSVWWLVPRMEVVVVVEGVVGGGWWCVVERHLTVHSFSESGTVLRVPISEPVF